MNCGIYKIINKINGKFYLGSSVDIKKRWKAHKFALRSNKHHSTHLQRAWNKYGENNFTFEIFREETSDLLIETEQFLLDELMPWDDSIGYNISKTATGGDVISYHPNREEIREKHRKNTKERWGKLSDQERLNYAAKMEGAGNPNWKGGTCITICPICGDKKKGFNKNRMSCNDCRDRQGENNSFYGKKHSVETRKKISDTHKSMGNLFNKQKISVEIDGVLYTSFSLAAKSIGCSIASIRNRLNNPVKFPNYKLIQKSEQTSSLTENSLQE